MSGKREREREREREAGGWISEERKAELASAIPSLRPTDRFKGLAQARWGEGRACLTFLLRLTPSLMQALGAARESKSTVFISSSVLPSD